MEVIKNNVRERLILLLEKKSKSLVSNDLITGVINDHKAPVLISSHQDYGFVYADQGICYFLDDKFDENKLGGIHPFYEKIADKYKDIHILQCNDLFKHLRTLPHSAIKNQTVSLTLPCHHVNGNLLWLLLKGNILAFDPNKHMFFFSKCCQDVTTFVPGNCLETSMGQYENENYVMHFYKKYHSKIGRIKFTDREMEILNLMAKGYSSIVIADKLHLSVHTVNTHRQRLLRKSPVKNTNELIYFAKTNNYI